MKPVTQDDICHFVQSHIANKLGCAPADVDIHTHISSLGIDSIELLTMTGELAEWLDTELPAEIFWDVETLHQASALIIGISSTSNKNSTPNNSEHLLTIKATGTAKPVFAIHDLTGETIEYMDLLQGLGEQYPVYGVHLENSDNLSIEALASKNVELITRQQAQGPYKLLGYCFGGVLAFETAKQLSQQGHTVEMLAIIDVKPPNTPLAPMFKTAVSACNIISNTLHALPHWFKREKQQGFISIKNKCKPKQTHAANTQHTLPANLQAIKQGMPDIYQDIAGKLLQQFNNYQPKAYSGDILLISSCLSAFSKANPAWHWQQLCTGNVEHHLLPGCHLGIMHPPYVGQTAHAINRYMQQLTY